jgi:hypothetical protein
MPYQTPFDPSRGPFKAGRNFRFSGIVYVRDDPFPAEGADTPDERKLKQLYETRYIRYADDQTPYVTRGIPDRPIDRRKQAIAAGQTGADDEVIAEKRQERIDALVAGNTLAKLVEMAGDIPLPTKRTKAVVAAAIVDAGRDSDDDGTA